jgi:hypothetical protein
VGHQPSFIVYHCIAYSRGTRLFLASLPLHICLFALLLAVLAAQLGPQEEGVISTAASFPRL